MGSAAARRQLQFTSYPEVVAEIRRLHAVGYRKTGAWTLGQICEHLSFFFRGSLDGFNFKLPWLVRVTLGKLVRRRMLRRQAIKPGSVTVPQSVPKAVGDETHQVAEAIRLLDRLANHSGELHDSPLLGRLTPDDWRRLHLIHAAHHLSFLNSN